MADRLKLKNTAQRKTKMVAAASIHCKSSKDYERSTDAPEGDVASAKSTKEYAEPTVALEQLKGGVVKGKSNGKMSLKSEWQAWRAGWCVETRSLHRACPRKPCLAATSP